jgi:ribulose bisphosphate carboxylase small subunit
MTPTTHTQNIIYLDMTKTKEEQKRIKQERWKGYNVFIIKDSQSALDKLNEILKQKKGKL